MVVERWNPAGLVPPPEGVYSHVSRATGSASYRISGQTAVDELGEVMCVGDMAGQAARCFEACTTGLSACGLSWADVTHIFIFTTDIISYLEHELAVTKPLFGNDPPPSTLLEVRRLADPAWLVEIQVDAVA